MCECIEAMNKALAPHGEELVTAFSFGEDPEVFPHIRTQYVTTTKPRGYRSKTIIPQFCPFCGTKYREEK